MTEDKLEKFKHEIKQLKNFELVSIDFGKSSVKIIEAICEEIKERGIKIPENIKYNLIQAKKRENIS